MKIQNRWVTIVALALTVWLAHKVYFPVRAQTSLPAIVAQIEGKQAANGGENDELTLLEVMQKKNVPGISVTVIQDFKIHWSKSYGIADVTTNEPVKDDTLFQAASISKPVTALAFVKAAQDGASRWTVM